MNKLFDFSKAVESFFNDYLVKERGSSPHTIRAYRDAFVLLIEYFEVFLNLKPERIQLEDITKKNIIDYLNWLERDKNVSISTRNHRLTVIKSFAHYMTYKDPTHLSLWKGISSISNKKGETGTLSYLTIEEIKILFEEIDLTSEKGRRDLTLLSLLYNSAARAQELVSLTPSSLRLSKPYVIEIFGKGKKKRIVPLEENIVRLLEQYIIEHKLDVPGMEYHPLFYNAWGEKLTTPGITYIINKYYKKAKESHPDMFKNKISPHVFRHSRAMHLLQAGVNLVYIRDILGHASINTTEIYARADSDQKRKALESAYKKIGITEPKTKSWERNNKLKEYLKSLA